MYNYSGRISENNYNNVIADSLFMSKTNTARQKTVCETDNAADKVKTANSCYNASFTANTIRTRLNSGDEQQKYKTILNNTDKQTRKNLEAMLKSGMLLNSDSENNSTVLDNLYNILTTPRANGLDAKSLVRDLVMILSNPYVITQQFGDIPNERRQEVLAQYKHSLKPSQPPMSVDVDHSGTCVAASIEFSLAQEMPAEFSRIAAGLTSPQISAQKTIHFDMLADNTLDAVWLLNAFDIPYKADNFNEAKITLKPDSNALIRAQIQTNYKDPWERSPIDVLMQSTFMQVGSQQSYNSLSDRRAGKFNQNDRGLIEFEKTFVESVVKDKNKISMTYQILDENARLIGYENDMDTVKRHLTQSIDNGENVILGYTQTDKNNVVINGHEITVVGYKRNPKTQKLIFICNDTDDGKSVPVEYSEDYLIPKIHHAALSKHIVEKEVKNVPLWKESLDAFNKMRKERIKNQAA